MNVPKKFKRRPGRLLNVLCTFNLRPVSAGQSLYLQKAQSWIFERTLNTPLLGSIIFGIFYVGKKWDNFQKTLLFFWHYFPGFMDIISLDHFVCPFESLKIWIHESTNLEPKIWISYTLFFKLSIFIFWPLSQNFFLIFLLRKYFFLIFTYNSQMPILNEVYHELLIVLLIAFLTVCHGPANITYKRLYTVYKSRLHTAYFSKFLSRLSWVSSVICTNFHQFV